MQKLIVGSLCLVLAMGGCAKATVTSQSKPLPSTAPEPSASAAAPTAPADAAVTAVSVSGEPGNYQFSVTIRSQETGCDAYANWWEVVTPEGQLLYRRVLFHSHVDEQPFTRSGGKVALAADEEAIVRVHFDPSGYSSSALQGTVETGFKPIQLPEDFAAELAQSPPLPQGCNF